MAGFAIPPLKLSEEVMEMFREYTLATRAMTAELKRYNDRDRLPTDGKRISFSSSDADTPGQPRTFVRSSQPGITALSEGSTVRVPAGMVALMLPMELMRPAIDGALRHQPPTTAVDRPDYGTD